MEYVVLVDEQDNEVGLMEKMEAHEKGLLHRAFSVFTFNDKGELLLQRRALSKYHSGGLWSNTCCSHPRSGETAIDAAHRRLEEEMGFDCELTKVFDFIYKKELDHGLTEHELDHVFIGTFNGVANINPDEVDEVKSIPLDELSTDIVENPDQYTEWFKICLSETLNHLRKSV
jgi:isopentenyl-diphosphate delta-isomerase